MIELDISAVHLDPKREECLRDMVEGKFIIMFSSAVCWGTRQSFKTFPLQSAKPIHQPNNVVGDSSEEIHSLRAGSHTICAMSAEHDRDPL